MISTHILDTSLGLPASDVLVRLQKKTDGRWSDIATEKTNQDGRIAFSVVAEAGTYRLIFGIEDYFRAQKIQAFFLDAEVSFQISDIGRKYHIPLLLNPFGYSTYRGS